MGYLKDYKENWRAPYQYRTKESRKWEAPPNGVFKVNVDGAKSDQGRNFCVRMVIRNSEGMVIAAWSKDLTGLFSIKEVEALAIESCILLTKDMKLSNIIIESDALTAVQSVEKGETRGCLGHLFHGIVLLKD